MTGHGHLRIATPPPPRAATRARGGHRRPAARKPGRVTGALIIVVAVAAAVVLAGRGMTAISQVSSARQQYDHVGRLATACSPWRGGEYDVNFRNVTGRPLELTGFTVALDGPGGRRVGADHEPGGGAVKGHLIRAVLPAGGIAGAVVRPGTAVGFSTCNVADWNSSPPAGAQPARKLARASG